MEGLKMSNTTLAGQRIISLLDENSFVEIGARITARATDFNLKQTETPSDGVITGYGVIDGNLVYVYSQDASVLGGSVGEMHAKKIANLYDLAMKTGAPVIGLIDSAGVRLQEASDALNAFGELYKKQVMASGVIPQITAVFGTCGGGLALIPALTDFTFMEVKKGRLFVNSPNALAGNEISRCDTSSCEFQSEKAGLVDIAGEENEIFAKIRELVSLLPANNEDNDSYIDCTDDLNRGSNIAGCIGDTGLAFTQIADDYSFFETKRNYAKEMATGFIRLNGATVGVVANRTEILDEEGKAAEKFEPVLTVRGCRKAVEFINFCDEHGIAMVFTGMQHLSF
jgi:acetyl-CoA carboxylase carboxyltransferase component